MATQREISKQEWDGNARIEDINSGSLQRIADATEKMAASYDVLRNERDYYKRRLNEEGERLKQYELKNASLRGVITRLRNKTAVAQ